MISVCIPVYNVEMLPLLRQLQQQLKEQDTPVEIVCIDDASDEIIRQKNRAECHSLACWVELEQNIGRARIRNLFPEYALYEYLLFLDCDGLIPSADFLKNYIDFLSLHKTSVVCGGRIFPNKKPPRNCRLRWKYGREMESKQAIVRNQNPNKSFMTNNFVIQKDLFQHVKFDERLSGYGHEDTLFGYQLREQNISVSHLENPILNGDMETNSEFLRKTERGIQNLYSVLSITDFQKDFTEEIALLKSYYKLKKSGILPLFQFFFILKKSFIRYILKLGYTNMKLFSIYKLGLFSEVAASKK